MAFRGSLKSTLARSPASADVTGPREEHGFGLAVAIDAHFDGVEKTQAEAIVKKAHENICPYLHAIRGNVQFDVRVV